MNERKFDKKGELYAKFRPNYPADFFNYLYTNVGMTKNSVIADIGSGTGILSKHLLERCSKVYAVEPNEDMRKIAQNELQQFDKFVSVCATAENTSLDIKSVDFITVGQAFHWFDKPLFYNECKRILKDNGKIILVWNVRDSQNNLIIENAAIDKIYCPDFKGFSAGAADKDLTNFFISGYDTRIFENIVILNEEQFIGRNLSSSFAPNEGDENYIPYVKALKSLFSRFCKGNSLAFGYLTYSYTGIIC